MESVDEALVDDLLELDPVLDEVTLAELVCAVLDAVELIFELDPEDGVSPGRYVGKGRGKRAPLLKLGRRQPTPPGPIS